MIRFSALVAIAFALAVFVGGSLAQAQKASDPRASPVAVSAGFQTGKSANVIRPASA
jgi:hypothetical protein